MIKNYVSSMKVKLSENQFNYQMNYFSISFKFSLTINFF